MWSCKPGARRAVPAAAALALAGAALGACGFEPLYGRNDGAGSANQRLAEVEIAHLPNRTGQTLRNLLIDRFHDSGKAAVAPYRLTVTLSATEQPLSVRKDATTARAQLVIRAPYTLVDTRTEQPLLSATSRAIAAYNILEQQYGNVAAVEHAYDRALTQIADEITARVAMALVNPPKPRPTGELSGEGAAKGDGSLPAASGSGDPRRPRLWSRRGAGARAGRDAGPRGHARPCRSVPCGRNAGPRGGR